ncbi:zinc-binding dehydrogenase [Dactylosporangium sp. CA-233914]|uniref:zinc-binding dehydrogenase n=1 Tax=Dactylosporangium sp. CA-233914 TaxID=3239934 RepID=UPI003D8C45B4
MKAVVFSGAGGNEVVELQNRPDPVPGDHEVLVSASYAGVNPADVLQRNGGYPVPPDAPQDVPGLETAGEVIAVGSRVRRWSVGDRVCGIVSGGGLADRVIAHEDHLLPAPEQLKDAELAALPEALITAYDALHRVGSAAGRVTVIRGINGGVGLAAAQLAAASGATVIGIGRSAEALAKVTELGITAVTDSEAADLVAQHGGADAVVELVGGSYVAADLAMLAVRGQIVVVSTAAGADPNVPLGLLMARRAGLHGTVLRGRSAAEKALLVAEVAKTALPLAASGRLTIPIDQVFAAEDVTAAFDRLSQSGKVGKVVLQFS